MKRMTRSGVAHFKAVLFDLDGTLIESSIDFMRFRARLIEYIGDKGADMSRYSLQDTSVSLISRFAEEMRGKGVGDREVDGFLDEIDAFIDEIEMERIGETKAATGAEALLKALRQRGVKIGILTRGSPVYAERALRISGLSGYVDAMIARDRKSGIPPKPDPRSAFALLEKLGASVEESIMVGDYSIDFVCSEDSGIRFFGVASDEESVKSLIECGCRNISKDLTELRRRIGA